MSQANTTKGKPDRLSDKEAVQAFAIAICAVTPVHEKYYSANYTLEYSEKTQASDDHVAEVVKTLKVYRYKDLLSVIEVVDNEATVYIVPYHQPADIQYGYLKSAMRRLLDGVILYDFSKRVSCAS